MTYVKQRAHDDGRHDLVAHGAVYEPDDHHVAQIIMNTSFRMFPGSAAASGQPVESEVPTADQIAYTQLLRGIHL